MPIKAGQIDIEIRASAQKLRGDMDGAVKEVKRLGAGGREAGHELAKGMEEAATSVAKVAKVTTEVVLSLAGGHTVLSAEVAKYSATAASSGMTTESLLNSYRALRIALSPTPFTLATVAIGAMAEETIRLVNARAKLIEQQSLIAAVSGIPIAAVQRIDAVSAISGGNAANVRSLSSVLSQRIDGNQTAVRSGLDTLGVSATEGRQGEPMDPALLEHIAAGFASIEDPAKRAAAAVQLFGSNNAATALKELDSSFVNASAAADKFGLTLDQTSRNQIYQARQEFVRLQAVMTEWGGLKGWWESFKQGTEIVGAAAEDMAVRGARSLHDLIDQYVPGMRELNALMHPGTPLSPAELGGGNTRKNDILTGLTADEMFAHEQTVHQDQSATLDGQKAAQASAQARADTAYGSLSSDAAKRQKNPHDTTLLSNEQRFSLAVQQQSAAAMATVIGEKVAAMEAAAAAQKLAQTAAEQLAAFQGKAGERLQALSDQVMARAMADDPVSAARFAAYVEVNRDSDRTTPAERASRAKILAVGVDRVQASEDAKREAADNAAVLKDQAERFAAVGNPLSGFLPTREGSSEKVRIDEQAETRQRDAGERSAHLATIQSQPGDESALAQRVLDIRLKTVAAERRIIEAHSEGYTLEDRTLAANRLQTEEENAQLTYENSIAEIEKSREQTALNAGGAYQSQLRAITQQLDALNQIKVTDQNITDIELARIALTQKAAEMEVQRLLALGTLKDGWDAFWVGMDEQAEKPGKILFDGMNSALDKVSGDLTNLVTGQKTSFGRDLESVGRSVTQSAIKSAMQTGLGALGKKLGIKSPGGKPDGTAAKPYHVIMDGAGAPKNPLSSLPGVGQLPPALGGATGAAASAGSGILGWLGKLFGSSGGSGAGESVTSSIQFMAGGGDADPGKIYGVAEAGEAELISPKNSSRITPLSKAGLGGGNHTYHIDARGADLGAENRVSRAIEYAHNAAVTSSVRATSERAKRTPKRS